jgi:PDZ domain-containing protein
MSRRVLVLAVAGFLTVLLAATAALLPVPYVRLQPGPTTNTLGKVGGTELIRIDGRRTYPDRGHLDLVTVSVLGGPRQRLDLFSAFKGWLDDSIAVVPETTIYPKGESADEAAKQSAAEMSDSQENATTAALRELGIPVTTRTVVSRIPRASPSQGKLEKDDVIVSVDGTKVLGSSSLRDIVGAHKPGDELSVVALRDGKEVTTSVTTAGVGGRTVIGVEIRDEADYPFSVEISLKDVGGPSAGLMFALGIVDKLTPGSLTGGKFIAGTGTIDDAGKVGAIGGITQKMIGARRKGATVFLSPASNCAQAKKTVPDGLRLVRVRTLSDSVEALDDLRAGRTDEVPTC